MIEYLTSFYSIALLATIIGLLIIYIYDKFEKKQYTIANYFRFAILIYISTFASLYLVNMISGTSLNILSGGGGSAASTSNNMEQPSLSSVSNFNDYHSKLHSEQFKTGIPTF
jgi:hypothetical protein